MSNKRDEVVDETAIKDPDDWKTGDEPMTGAQRSYLETLATQAGEETEGGRQQADGFHRREGRGG